MNSVLPPDAQLGAYRIVREVGAGGMGVVYEAWDTRLDRRVAIKTIHPHLIADSVMAERFRQEARSAARVEHPNIARVYRVESCNDQLIIEMEFIEGTPLNAVLKSKPFTLGEGVNLLRQVLDGLAACHEKGVVHCDLKPANILVGRDKRICLTDFGVARLFYGDDAGRSRENAAPGPVWGTPHYSPPEAWKNGPVTPAWDLYSAGVLTFEALTGSPPFDAPTTTQLVKKILTESPPGLRDLCPDASPELAGLMAELLAREPEHRPASAGAALARLRMLPEHRLITAQTQPLEVSSAAMEPESAPPGRARSRRRLALLCGAIAAVGILAALWAITQPPAAQHEDAARGVAAVSGPANLLAMAGRVYFADDDPEHGRELWMTTGTPGEKKLLADIVPGPQSSNPQYLMVRPFGGIVFNATTPEAGNELWYLADLGGDNVSVRMIKDIIPGAMGSDPKPVAAYETQVLFFATTLNEGRELWCTNGLEPQTAMVADTHPGRQGLQPTGLAACTTGSGAYLIGLVDGARGQVLLYYDYLSNTLGEVADVSEDTGSMAILGNRLLFANHDKQHGMEPWTYDPATKAARMLADLCPGPASSGPSEFFQWRGRVYFSARTGKHGHELWTSDGTPEGTRLVKDINPGPGDSDPYGFRDAGGLLVFRAHNDAVGRELWGTDGTEEQTRCLADVRPGPADSTPYNLVWHGDWLFFSADDGVHGEELWTLRLSDAGAAPRLVQDLYPGPDGSEPYEMVWHVTNRGVFRAILPEIGPQLVSIRIESADFVLEPI